MAQFSYTAKDSDGSPKEGTISAGSIEAAREALKQMSYAPEEIHETTLAEELPSPNTEEDSSLTPEKAAELLSFVTPDALEPPAGSSEKEQESDATHTYFPLIDTLRLYAGWLLAWYFLVYALGSYQHLRPLPFTIPFVEGLFLSPLVLSFALAAYLFLLLTGLQKRMGGGFLRSSALWFLGIAAFVIYRMNVA